MAFGSACCVAAAFLRASSPRSGATRRPAVAAADPIMNVRRDGSSGLSSSSEQGGRVMRHLTRFLLLVLLATSARGGDFAVRNYRFHDGETMAEVRIHFVTIGAPRKDNVVLILHGTGGSSKQFLNDHFAGVLFKPGGLLDSSKYFIVIPDSVGHGESSKPSDGLGRKFPHYDYTDMTDLQHRLLESLGVDHVFLVMGTSMGAMHTWMW